LNLIVQDYEEKIQVLLTENARLNIEDAEYKRRYHEAMLKLQDGVNKIVPMRLSERTYEWWTIWLENE